jgi:hypothetical protein
MALCGRDEWQRLEEPKLRIPEIKGDSLALEFRPVDSKGFLGNAIQQQVYVPVPTLKITKQEPPNGPIAGEPFTIEFEATSPVGRTVHVEWRYAGETQWQRLEEPKLRIPEVKGDSLVLEFRAVDSKDFAGSVVQGRWQVFVPTPTLKITKQDPPNGPIAGDPFTVEFEATSPVGRAVHVEWRYAGETQWQRLEEPKLRIPEVKGDSSGSRIPRRGQQGLQFRTSCLYSLGKDSYAKYPGSAAVHGARGCGQERRGDARWQIRRFGKRGQNGAFVGPGDGERSAAVHGARGLGQ